MKKNGKNNGKKKGNNTVYFILAAVCMIAFAACKKSTENGSDIPSKQLFPNTIGDTWHYLVKDTTIQDLDSSSTEYNVDVEVIDTTLLSGGIKAAVWQFRYPSHTDTNYVYQVGDTIKFLPKVGPNYFCPGQYILPFALGSSWPYAAFSIYDVSVLGQGNITISGLVFKNTWEIKGIAGRPDGFFLIDEWFENEVGFVRMYRNTYGELLGLRHNLDWNLVSYELK